MNFPMQEPFFQFIYWLINTAGVGGIAVGILALTIFVSVFLMLRWITAKSQTSEADRYAYPTPALHHEPSPSGWRDSSKHRLWPKS